MGGNTSSIQNGDWEHRLCWVESEPAATTTTTASAPPTPPAKTIGVIPEVNKINQKCNEKLDDLRRKSSRQIHAAATMLKGDDLHASRANLIEMEVLDAGAAAGQNGKTQT